MLALRIEVPFATFRPFTAGWYRPSATFMTPSAAYGLLLNIAGIEMRLREDEDGHSGKAPASITRKGLPELRLAMGIPSDSDGFPRIQTIYQQLHNYPVGKDAGVDPSILFGSKNNITPVRRELLVDLKVVLLMDGNSDLEKCVRHGLAGKLNASRYGLPFIGDNQFLPDRIDEVDFPLTSPVRWYERYVESTGHEPRQRSARMTTWIDRESSANTKSTLYAPSDELSLFPSDEAWTVITPPK